MKISVARPAKNEESTPEYRSARWRGNGQKLSSKLGDDTEGLIQPKNVHCRGNGQRALSKLGDEIGGYDKPRNVLWRGEYQRISLTKLRSAIWCAEDKRVVSPIPAEGTPKHRSALWLGNKNKQQTTSRSMENC